MIDLSATRQPDDVPPPEPGEPVPRRVRAPRSGMALRLSQLGWALTLVLGSAAGATLATFWITSIPLVALGPEFP